jgi:CPA2 family monovalent cation:H+ antiporter-2
VVVGYGPVGRALSKLLSEHGIVPTIVELNPDTVKALEAQGVSVVHGDASRPAVLEAAGIARARSLLFAGSGAPPEMAIRTAKELNPDIRVLVRSAYLSEVPVAEAAGADIVVSAEREVAFALAEELLGELGARDRARHTSVRHEGRAPVLHLE